VKTEPGGAKQSAAARGLPRPVRAAAAVLSHPVVLILVGAAVSNFVIPDITRSWQDHQRVLDIKGSVIREINTSTGDFLGTIRLVAVQSGPGGERELDAAFGRWQIGSNDVRAQLSTYFPERTLLTSWRTYQTSVLYLYALFKYRTAGQRELGLTSVAKWFPASRRLGQIVRQQIESADTFTSSLGRERLAISYLDQINALLDLYSRRADEIDSLILDGKTRL
jgi:hypothetical protein